MVVETKVLLEATQMGLTTMSKIVARMMKWGISLPSSPYQAGLQQVHVPLGHQTADLWLPVVANSCPYAGHGLQLHCGP